MAEQNPHDWKVRWIVLFVVIGCLAFGYWLWRSMENVGGGSRYPISWFIIVFAILGSVVNESYREVEFLKTTIGRIGGYFLWKAAVAVVFAFVLYLMIIGGLIGGDMFPEFVAVKHPAGAPWDMQTFLTGVDPKGHKDIAKILVWSFIAGYTERFVPNAVGRVIKTTEEGDANG